LSPLLPFVVYRLQDKKCADRGFAEESLKTEAWMRHEA
jgi:hypothetical protein